MLDIRRIRTNPDEVKASLARRGIETSEVDSVVELDARQRALATERDDLRNQIKVMSKEVGRLRKDGQVAEAEDLQVRSRELGSAEQALADQTTEVDDEIHQLLLRIPNTRAPLVYIFRLDKIFYIV